MENNLVLYNIIMINERNVKMYCKDDISLIENYDKAIADNTKIWHCHHRRETIYSKKDLIEIGEYYNIPAYELILLTNSDHAKLHNKLHCNLSTLGRSKGGRINGKKAIRIAITISAEKRHKPIIMLDEHKNIIAEFKTTREASISTGIPRRTINNALSDGHMLKQSKTFWEFKKKDTNL